jgi:hypothetical protein
MNCEKCKKHFYVFENDHYYSFCEDKESQVSHEFARQSHFCCVFGENEIPFFSRVDGHA